MSLHRSLLLVILTFTLAQCGSSKKLYPNHYNDTPNGIAVNDTLMYDQTEVTNFQWLEYMFWMERIHGKKSKEYKAILPDTTVWNEYACLTPNVDYYLRHPAYRDYPLVGITQEQAIDYSNWRSDRVYEYYLIKEEIILHDPNQTKKKHFTIHNYLKGIYTGLDGKNKDAYAEQKIISYPRFRLPTLNEHQVSLHYSDSINELYASSLAKKSNWRNENSHLRVEIIPCDSAKLLIEPTVYVTHGYPAKKKWVELNNLHGNVAEWTAQSSMTVGGSWFQTSETTLSNKPITATLPNAWTGFRNVCTWQEYTRE